MKTIAILALLTLTACGSPPPAAPPPTVGTVPQSTAICGYDYDPGIMTSAQIGPLTAAAGGGYIEYQLPQTFNNGHRIDYVAQIAARFPDNIYACWDATPPGWYINGSGPVRGYRGSIGTTGDYATYALHVWNYRDSVDECWFQQIDPTYGLEPWFKTDCVWFYLIGGTDRTPPLPRD